MTPGRGLECGWWCWRGRGRARRVCVPWSRREPANSLITDHHQTLSGGEFSSKYPVTRHQPLQLLAGNSINFLNTNHQSYCCWSCDKFECARSDMFYFCTHLIMFRDRQIMILNCFWLDVKSQFQFQNNDWRLRFHCIAKCCTRYLDSFLVPVIFSRRGLLSPEL